LGKWGEHEWIAKQRLEQGRPGGDANARERGKRRGGTNTLSVVGKRRGRGPRARLWESRTKMTQKKTRSKRVRLKLQTEKLKASLAEACGEKRKRRTGKGRAKSPC